MAISVNSPAHIETLLAALTRYATDQLAEAGWTCRRINRSEYAWTGPKAYPDHPAAGLLIAVYQAGDALGDNNPLAALTAGMLLSSELAAVNEPEAMARYISEEQSRRAKKTRRPRLRTRAMLAAFADGRENADAVEGFFQDGGEFSDEWGEISIYSDDGEFIVTDEGGKLSAGGQRPTATITRKNIPTLIAQTRKKPV